MVYATLLYDCPARLVLLYIISLKIFVLMPAKSAIFFSKGSIFLKFGSLDDTCAK
jgi:hypothetical protein